MKSSLLSTLLFMAIIVLFQYCKPSQVATQSSTTVSDEPMISFAGDIMPFVKTNCAPCHLGDGARQTLLDSHASVRDNIKEIVRRVELAPEEAGYMPFKSKREALTPDQIASLKTWAKQGFGE